MYVYSYAYTDKYVSDFYDCEMSFGKLLSDCVGRYLCDSIDTLLITYEWTSLFVFVIQGGSKVVFFFASLVPEIQKSLIIAYTHLATGSWSMFT